VWTRAGLIPVAPVSAAGFHMEPKLSVVQPINGIKSLL
jgi:hypothetical protein